MAQSSKNTNLTSNTKMAEKLYNLNVDDLMNEDDDDDNLNDELSDEEEMQQFLK